eukprot:365072-Chlamydomonas_euryale.AAC.15
MCGECVGASHLVPCVCAGRASQGGPADAAGERLPGVFRPFKRGGERRPATERPSMQPMQRVG